MKASVGTLALIGAVLLAGSALAQAATPPPSGPSQTIGPRTIVTSVSTGGQSGSENGEARATVTSTGGIDIESWSWGRIDRVNTVQACTARRGEVVIHQGVQQCRRPAANRQGETNSALGAVSTTR